ncbi:hypothetical protein CTAYLR_000100 [Chrysophaeum taylorii]|uniref:N-alpha-acetyltransferase 40 n=1 Tax=Chrysophaeum taylorii TaxID=2483200 RepID=A0AAD7UHA2_9STRA|nr:hypothetical protein CTAYLR_000100 [Chrysophaeum taylorii]
MMITSRLEEAQGRCPANDDEGSEGELMGLLEANMRAMYEASPWGWDGPAKREEVSRAHRIVATRDGVLAGFALFRFEPDDEEDPERAVLYVRELQISPRFRRTGVGTELMRRLHRLAKGLDAVMLTVFKANTSALRFYTALGYDIDQDDPTNYDDRSACYYILSAKPRLGLPSSSSSSSLKKKRKRRDDHPPRVIYR